MTYCSTVIGRNPWSDPLTGNRRGASPAAVTPEMGPESAERPSPATASAAAVAMGSTCDTSSCGLEAAPAAVVQADRVADSCIVSSQSQASARSRVSGALGSSWEGNLVEVPSMLWIRSRPEVYGDSSGVVASLA